MTLKSFYSFVLVAAMAPVLVFGQDAPPAEAPGGDEVAVPQPAPRSSVIVGSPNVPAPAPLADAAATNPASAQPPIPSASSFLTNRPPRRAPQPRQLPSPPVPGAAKPLTTTGASASPSTGTNAAASTIAAAVAAANARQGLQGLNTNVDANSPGAVKLGSTNTLAGSGDNDIYFEELNLGGATLDQILDLYGDLVKRTLLEAHVGQAAIPDPGKAQFGLKIRSPLTKAEAIMALEAVLGMNGITIVPIGDKFAKVVPEAVAPMAGAMFSTNDSKHLPQMGRMITQVVQYKYVSGQDLIQILTPFAKSASSIMAIGNSQTLVIRDYTENVQRMLELVEKVDVPSLMEIKPEVIKIKFALANDISQVLSSLSSGGGGGLSVGGSSGSRSGSSGFGSSSMGMGSSGLGSSSRYGNSGSAISGGMSGLGGSTGLGAAGGGGLAGGTRSSFQRNLNSIISKAANSGDFQILGNAKIIADERTNSLLVFANKEDMEMIKLIISKLDVVLAQVLIEAVILEVSMSNGHDVGVSYLQHARQGGSWSGAGGVNNTSSASSFYEGLSSSSTNALGSLPSGFSYFTSINKDLDVVLTAIQTDSRANVLSRPRIQTSHAVSASLFVGETVPYVTGTYSGGSAYGNSANYSQLSVGITLEVLPLINPDGLVVMDIQQNVEQIGKYVTIGDNQVPQTTKRQAQAKVAVHDRDTIMLGGFITDSKSKSHSGVPWLMDVPLLGSLFRSNSDKNDRTELIVLIRPTVLGTPKDAAQFASEERDKLAGVKQAELEIREAERKNNEKIDKELKAEADKRAKKAKKANTDTLSDDEKVHHWSGE